MTSPTSLENTKALWMRVWYEANRESFFVRYGPWTASSWSNGPDKFMLAMLAKARHIEYDLDPTPIHRTNQRHLLDYVDKCEASIQELKALLKEVRDERLGHREPDIGRGYAMRKQLTARIDEALK